MKRVAHSIIMAAVLVTTCANNLMGVRARVVGSIRTTISHNIHRNSNMHCNSVDKQISISISSRMPSSSLLHARSMSSSMAFISLPSRVSPNNSNRQHALHQHQPIRMPTITALPLRAKASMQYSLSGGGLCSKSFHTSTTLMMKKNGGKSNRKARLHLPKKKDKSNKRSDEMDASPLSNANLSQLLQDDDDADDDAAAEEEQPPEFTATFASDYHAPVMPTECIDALLKNGEWGDMLLDKKERWRKKRSINEAKLRRAGLLLDDEEGGDEEDESGNDNDEISDAASEPRLFIDGTLGGGGHSQALLEQLRPGDILLGCDVDPEALATASNRLIKYVGTTEYILDKIDNDATDVQQQQPSSSCGWKEEDGRPMFIPVQSNFRNLISVLSKVRHPVSGKLMLGERNDDDDDNDGQEVEFPNGVNGMLLDLGVSSHQIDTGERGFAFMKDGPLDMRMSGDSQVGTLTAADICNEFDEGTLIDLLRTYGDEPRAKRISSAIVASRPLHTTTDLVHAINTVTPTFARQKRAGLIATSARVFQALRIVVNEEDGALKDVLEGVAPWALALSTSHFKSPKDKYNGVDRGDDGLLVVLSYHSMEDKMAKRIMRDGKVDDGRGGGRRRGGGALERDVYGNIIGEDDPNNSNLPFEPLSKPRKATDEEVAVNKRSRSATLRVGVRI